MRETKRSLSPRRGEGRGEGAVEREEKPSGENRQTGSPLTLSLSPTGEREL